MKNTLANNIKKPYLNYIIKQNKVTKKCKVYRLLLQDVDGKPTLLKKSMVKKNLTLFEAKNIIHLLTTT